MLSPEVERQLRLGREFMEEYRDTLRELAKRDGGGEPVERLSDLESL